MDSWLLCRFQTSISRVDDFNVDWKPRLNRNTCHAFVQGPFFIPVPCRGSLAFFPPEPRPKEPSSLDYKLSDEY